MDVLPRDPEHSRNLRLGYAVPERLAHGSAERLAVFDLT